jgi:hypothetical protein
MITSLVESLGDKHSSYFPPKEAKEFTEVLSGDFEGIGAIIDEHIRGIIIRKIFPNSPAKKAGLKDKSRGKFPSRTHRRRGGEEDTMTKRLQNYNNLSPVRIERYKNNRSYP